MKEFLLKQQEVDRQEIVADRDKWINQRVYCEAMINQCTGRLNEIMAIKDRIEHFNLLSKAEQKRTMESVGKVAIPNDPMEEYNKQKAQRTEVKNEE